MTDVLSIFTNEMLIVSLASWAIAQISKLVINLIIEKRILIERLFGDGGMPSGHSATVTSLAVIVGWTEGFGSAAFAIAFVLAVVVMHDACGVRRETGKHAASIKELAEALNSMVHESDYEVRTEKLKVLVGHTPLQVFFGALLGITVAVGYILIFLV